MNKKTIIVLYIIAIAVAVAIIVYYRKNILTDALNDKLDRMFETNYTPAYLQNANTMFASAVINDKFKPTANKFLSIAKNNKALYQSIASKVNPFMPYYFIAILHARESDCNFNTHLHNGDSLKAKTVNVPAGRPTAPPANGVSYTFEESAIDALQYDGFNKWSDFSVAGMIYCFEKYNGFGYARRKKVSPYLWSGTQHYTSGKFVADNKFSDTAIDKQIGAATLLKHFLNNQI